MGNVGEMAEFIESCFVLLLEIFQWQHLIFSLRGIVVEKETLTSEAEK